ncbi:MAG: hypothetical protein D6761_13265 [Candidatus Dadabacteria bacterium]|nr:MAG: hypothetical protein D6761_13265 [Candidatus Dadabacteria bacterium]
MFGVARVVLLLVLVGGVIAAGPLVWAFAAGFARDPALYADATYLLRVLFPFIYFMGLIGVGMGLLHVRGRFVVPAVGPMLLNIGLIAGAGVAWWRMQQPGQDASANPLAIGVLAGVAAWWLWMRVAATRQQIDVRSSIWPLQPEVRHVGRLLLPALAGLSVYQLQVIVGTQFASFLPEGGFTCLWYADRLVQFPMAMVGTAVATVALPVLSNARVKGGDTDEALSDVLQFSTFVVVPAAIGLYIVREPLIDLVFGWGHFDDRAVARTAAATGALAVSLVPGALNRVLTANLYSEERMAGPIVAGAAALIVQALCSWQWLEQDVEGLARAIAVASVAQLLVLTVLARRSGQRIAMPLRGVAATIAAAVCMVGALQGVDRAVASWTAGPRLAILVATGIAAYAVIAVALRHPEAQRLIQRFSSRR